MNKNALFLLTLATLSSFYTIHTYYDDGSDILVPAFAGAAIGGAAGGGRGFGIGLGAGLLTGAVIHEARRERRYHYDYDRYDSRSCRREIKNFEQENRQLINDYNKLATHASNLEQQLSRCTGTRASVQKRRSSYQPSYSRTRGSYGRGYDCRDALEQLDRENNKILDDYNNLLQYTQELEEELNECLKQRK